MSKNGTLFFERSFIPKIFWFKFDVTSALVKNIHHKVIMGHHVCFKYGHLSLLIWSKIEMFGSWQRDLKPIVLPWQQHIRYHFASHPMYITGAKFEWQNLNASRNS